MIDFTLSKPVMGLSNTKDPGQIILGTTVEYKRFSAFSQANMFRHTLILANIMRNYLPYKPDGSSPM